MPIFWKMRENNNTRLGSLFGNTWVMELKVGENVCEGGLDKKTQLGTLPMVQAI